MINSRRQVSLIIMSICVLIMSLCVMAMAYKIYIKKHTKITIIKK